MNKYDPTAVIAAANAKLAAGDLEGGQFIFQSSLLEWTDDAREGGGTGSSSGAPSAESLREAVATLWLAYAQFLISAKQFKSATEAYEEAIRCPVAGTAGRVYAEYARFAVERNKRKTAQDVFKKALIVGAGGGGAVQDEQDRELLWNDFLEMMRTTNPDLTMAALRKAVAEQDDPSSPPSKRLKLVGDNNDDNSDGASLVKLGTTTTTAFAESKTHVVTLESVQEQAKQFADQLLQRHAKSSTTTTHGMPPDVMAAWMSRDGHGAPQHAPEPPLFTASPPKLSDPTAKDILGIDLAVQLVQRLLSPSGGIVLEVCRGLWMLQALKELTSREDIQALDKSLLVQHERLEGELDARLSVTAAGSAVANAVAQMNERERHNFQLQAAQQRQQVLTQSTWDLRQLLCWQQQALAKLQVPGFEEGPTSIDEESLQLQSQICQYLHSAFYIRNRMGSEPHETMLKSQLKKLLRDQQEGGVGSSRNSPKMSRLSPIPPPPSFNNSNMSNMMMPMPMQQLPPQYNAYPPQQQQQQLMQPQLQPMLMGMPPQQYNAYHAQQQHQQGMMMYGQQQPPPMMMMHQQQLQQQQPYIMQQQQQQHLQLPPLPPNQPQPPPYGGPPQYPYYQQ